MKRELSTIEWAFLLVASDVAAIIVTGLLVAVNLMPASVAVPILVAVVARGRTSAAVTLVRNSKGVHGERKHGGNDDDPPPGGAYVSGAVVALFFWIVAVWKGRTA